MLTAGMVAEVTGGRLVSGSPSTVFTSASIDSRTIERGGLFFGLRGVRDGEAFAGSALARGATGLVLTKAPDGSTPVSTAVIVVADTLAALQALGRAVRRRSGARVVAITGSAGKTTTKEIAAHLVEARHRTYRSHGNFNNHIGLPLSLIELASGPDVAVVELGMNHAGEIRRLVELAEPEVRVWTNVGDAHIGYFGSREAIASAKAEILERATPGMVVVANEDDPLVRRHVEAAGVPAVTFGESPASTIRIARIVDRGLDGTEARIETPAGRLEVSLSLPGRVQLFNAAAAVAVALHFDVPLAEITARLEAVRPVARRGAQTMLASGARLVDDSYNASPEATVAMLDALGRTASTGRRVAVLGEMLELGALARQRHIACGQAAARAGVDVLIVVGGPAADGVVDGAIGAGFSREQLHRFPDSLAAAGAIRGLVRPGDLVLVKGSRGTRTDRVADRLLEAA